MQLLIYLACLEEGAGLLVPLVEEEEAGLLVPLGVEEEGVGLQVSQGVEEEGEGLQEPQGEEGEEVGLLALLQVQVRQWLQSCFHTRSEYHLVLGPKTCFHQLESIVSQLAAT